MLKRPLSSLVADGTPMVMGTSLASCFAKVPVDVGRIL